MRYTRNRQQAKVSGKLFYLAYKSQEISKWNQYESALDKSFKWHRLFNQVSYKERYRGLESYVLIGLYSKRTSRLVDSR